MKRYPVLPVVLVLMAACAPGQPPAPTITPTPSLTPTTTPTATATPTPTSYPMRLEQVGQFGGIASLLALNGNMIYLQVGPRLVTVDVSDPRRPKVIGHSEVLPQEFTDIVVMNQHALVQDKNRTIWEFETPARGDPHLLRSYDLSDTDRPKIPSLDKNLAVAGGYLFKLIDEFYTQDSAFLEIHEMKNDGLITSAIPPLPDGVFAQASNFVIRGRYGYVAAYDHLRVLDLGVDPERVNLFPGNPEPIYIYAWKIASRLSTDVGTLGHGCCAGYYIPDICVIEKYLYVNNAAWDLDHPEIPQPAVNPPHPSRSCDEFQISNGVINGNSMDQGDFQWLDMRDPVHPLSHKVSTGRGYGEIKAIVANRLYDYRLIQTPSVGTPGNDLSSDLLIFDIADPGHPKLLGGYSPLGWSGYTKINVIGSYAYVNVPEGFKPQRIVLDVSDPALPKQVDPPNPSFFDAKIIVRNNIVYALESDKLSIYALGDQLKPLTTVAIPKADNLRYADDRLFVISYPDEPLPPTLTIFDIHDPASPRVLAVTQQDELYEVGSYGDYLYLQLQSNGIGIFKLVQN